MTMLELDETVASLEEANTDFNTTYNGRSIEKLTRKSQYTMKKIRPEVDAAYTEMANAINVLYQANELAYKVIESYFRQMKEIGINYDLAIKYLKRGNKHGID